MNRGLAIAIAVAGLASGCSDERIPDSAPYTAPGAPCTELDTGGPARPEASGGPIAVETVAQEPFSGVLSSTTLWSHYIAFGYDTKRLVVCDLRTGKATVPAGFGDDVESVITYVTGSNTTVVYTTYASMPSTVGGTDWTIESRDLTGHRKHRHWAAGRSGYVDLPQPVLDWPWLAWVEAAGSQETSADARTGVVWVANARSGDKKQVAEAKQIGGVAVSQGSVFFDAANADGRGRELFRVPTDGSGPAVKLTSQGGVRKPTAANGRVVWRNETKDGDERFTMAPTDAEPTRLPVTGAAVPGRDFLLVADDTTRRLGVLDLAAMSAGLVPVSGAEDMLDPRAYWSVNGELVSWVTIDNPDTPNGMRRLHFARVVRRPGPR